MCIKVKHKTIDLIEIMAVTFVQPRWTCSIHNSRFLFCFFFPYVLHVFCDTTIILYFWYMMYVQLFNSFDIEHIHDNKQTKIFHKYMTKMLKYYQVKDRKKLRQSDIK